MCGRTTRSERVFFLQSLRHDGLARRLHCLPNRGRETARNGGSLLISAVQGLGDELLKVQDTIPICPTVIRYT